MSWFFAQSNTEIPLHHASDECAPIAALLLDRTFKGNGQRALKALGVENSCPAFVNFGGCFGNEVGQALQKGVKLASGGHALNAPKFEVVTQFLLEAMLKEGFLFARKFSGTKVTTKAGGQELPLSDVLPLTVRT